jgi:glycosyltransferase involved in cell wall biosynthesis
VQVARSRRFVIDGSMARSGGGFTYLVNILPHLSAMAPDDRFRVLVRSPRLADSLPDLPNVEVERLPEAGLAERFRFLHVDAPRLARRWGADLYFSVGEYSPLRASCPVIAAFRNPNVFTSLDQGWPLAQKARLKALRSLAWLSARTAERILFVSQDSADWMADVVGLPPRRRAVVHHGIDASQWASPQSGPREGFILSVSSVYRYKNFVRLIEAYAQLARVRSHAPDLVIVGDDQDPEYSAKMRAARDAAGDVAERIHLVGEVPYAEVKRYYQNAGLFVFPSYLETFGHPLLEAMASEVPLVAADIPVFREIAGDAALYADPHKPSALAAAMDEALFDEGLRRRLVERGRRRVLEFGWDHTAARLLALFGEVLGERSPRKAESGAFSRPARGGRSLGPAIAHAQSMLRINLLG